MKRVLSRMVSGCSPELNNLFIELERAKIKEWPRQQERPQRHHRKVSGCESGWGEKVVTTSYLITTKSYKEDVISILILWIRKQRIRGAE